jgi:hypothetical protein
MPSPASRERRSALTHSHSYPCRLRSSSSPSRRIASRPLRAVTSHRWTSIRTVSSSPTPPTNSAALTGRPASANRLRIRSPAALTGTRLALMLQLYHRPPRQGRAAAAAASSPACRYQPELISRDMAHITSPGGSLSTHRPGSRLVRAAPRPLPRRPPGPGAREKPRDGRIITGPCS